MWAVLAADLTGDVEQARDRATDVARGPDEHDEQAGNGERGHQGDDEGDVPGAVVGESEADHLPTATLRSARAA